MMNEIKFSCEKCVFAEYTSFKGKDIQYGCRLNRVQKLNPEDRYEESDNKSFFVFNRFCNTMRPQEWLEQYCNSDLNFAVKEAREEVRPRLSFIVKFDYNMDTFKQIMDSIRNQIDTRKFIIVINDKPEYNIEIFSLLEEMYKDSKLVSYHILMPPNELQYIYDTIDEALAFCKNGWIVFLDEGEIPPFNLAEKIDNRINDELRRFVYCNKKDNKTFIIQAAIYKLLGGNSPKILEDGSMDQRSFLERINELKAEDPDCLISWESMFND
jgi:hypothetical protein